MFPRHSEPQVALGITPTWYLLVFEFLLPCPKQKVLHNVSYLIAVVLVLVALQIVDKKVFVFRIQIFFSNIYVVFPPVKSPESWLNNS